MTQTMVQSSVRLVRSNRKRSEHKAADVIRQKCVTSRRSTSVKVAV